MISNFYQENFQTRTEQILKGTVFNFHVQKKDEKQMKGRGKHKRLIIF